MKRGYIYILKSPQGIHKIGITDNVDRRKKEIERARKENLTLVRSFEALDYRGIEAYLHSTFSEKRVKGEWFKLEPGDMDEIEFWANHEQGMVDYWDKKHGR